MIPNIDQRTTTIVEDILIKYKDLGGIYFPTEGTSDLEEKKTIAAG